MYTAGMADMDGGQLMKQPIPDDVRSKMINFLNRAEKYDLRKFTKEQKVKFPPPIRDKMGNKVSRRQKMVEKSRKRIAKARAMLAKPGVTWENIIRNKFGLDNTSPEVW